MNLFMQWRRQQCVVCPPPCAGTAISCGHVLVRRSHGITEGRRSLSRSWFTLKKFESDARVSLVFHFLLHLLVFLNRLLLFFLHLFLYFLLVFLVLLSLHLHLILFFIFFLPFVLFFFGLFQPIVRLQLTLEFASSFASHTN